MAHLPVSVCQNIGLPSAVFTVEGEGYYLIKVTKVFT